jgi:hypothetical protein
VHRLGAQPGICVSILKHVREPQQQTKGDASGNAINTFVSLRSDLARKPALGNLLEGPRKESSESGCFVYFFMPQEVK